MLKSLWQKLYKHFPNNHFVKTNYFKSNGNIFYTIDDLTGEKKYFPKIKGLNVLFGGKNSTLIIHSNPIPKFKNTTIHLNNDNNFFEIQSSKYTIQYCWIYSSSKNGKLSIGKNLYLAGGQIVLGQEANAIMNIGDDCLFSSGIIIRTSDSHTLIDLETKAPINPPKNVTIENHVWLSEGVKVLKGSYISEGSTVAAGAIITKEFMQKNVVLGGMPAQILRENTSWDRQPYDVYLENFNTNN